MSNHRLSACRAARERTPGWYEMDLTGVSTTRCVAVMLDGGESFGLFPIGFLTWDAERGTVEGVYVNEDYRRKGIATHLLTLATELHGSPVGDSGEYTAEGFKWAKAAGIAPKMKVRTPKSDMARMTSRLTHILWGGRRCKTFLEGLNDRAKEDA